MRIPTRFTLCLAASLIAISLLGDQTSAADDLFVSPAGQDTADGTQARPVSTLRRALEIVKKLSPRETHIVHMAAGIYPLDSPAVIAASLSPTPPAKLIIKGDESNARAVIDGKGLPKQPNPDADEGALIGVFASGVTIENLKFQNSPGVGVLVKNTLSCSVDHSEFYKIGTHGIVGRNVRQCSFLRNHISDVAGSGIMIVSGSRPTLETGDIVVSENTISNVNMAAKGGSWGNGIAISGVGIVVSNNSISDSANEGGTMGIRASGNNHLIEKNDLRHVSYGDAGAIYILGRDLTKRGTIVRFNYIEDCANGVYLDDRASGNIVTGNYIDQAKNAAVLIGGGQDNIVKFNVAAGSKAFMAIDDRGVGWPAHPDAFKDDFRKFSASLSDQATRAIYFKAYPLLAKITEKSALLPSGNEVDENTAERDSMALRTDDYSHTLRGPRFQEFYSWNKLKVPRVTILPKKRPLDFGRMGAPGLTSDLVGVVPETPPIMKTLPIR